MKILYVITGLTLGGAEKVVIDLANRMCAKGHIVKIVYLKGEIELKPDSNDIELINLNLNSAFSIIRSFKLYGNFINDYKPDVIHSHMIHANIFARLNNINKYYKLICTAHNANEGGKLRMLAYQLTDSLCNINTNVSNEATEAFISKKAFTKKAITVYNGIDLVKFNSGSVELLELKEELKLNGELIFLAVGRLTSQKDYPNLIKSITFLKKQIARPFKLFIVGDGELREEIENTISRKGLTENIILLGRRDDIPQLMSLADVFILSSSYEGFGLVVAEAMACGTLVVATDSGGVKEVLGGNGFLVPPKDSKALSNAIIQAISLSEQEKSVIVNKALLHVQNNFDLEIIIQKWLELYEK